MNNVKIMIVDDDEQLSRFQCNLYKRRGVHPEGIIL